MSIKAICVTLVDDLGRTVARFSNASHFDQVGHHEKTESWSAQAAPISEKWLNLDGFETSYRGRLPQLPIGQFEDERYLTLPGLTVKWEKVAAVLDRLAASLDLVDASGVVLVDDMNAATLTIDQLRYGIRS